MRKSLFGVAVGCVLVACGGNGDPGGTQGSGGEASTATGAGGDTPTGPGGSGGQAQSSTGGATTGTSGTGGATGCVPSLPTFADGKSPSATLQVKAGAAAGGDGSAAKPFATLLAALQVAKPGTEVRVSGSLPANTYTTGLSGTPDAPIWITGEPGAKIGPLTLEGAHSIVVQDLEIAGSPAGHVLHFFFADHLLFRRLHIHDAGLGCVKGSQSTQVYMEDSDLEDAGKAMGHPVLDYVGVNNGHIVRTTLHHGPGVMVMLKGGTSDLLFAWNEVFDQTAAGNALALGQSTGPMYFQPIDAAFEGLRIIAFANALHDLVGAPVAFEGCKDCAALHNTIWNTTGSQLVRFLPGAAGMSSGVTTSLSQGCRFAGNAVVGGQAGGASLNADPQNHGPGNVIDYNVFLKPGSLNWWGDIAQDMTHSTYDQDPKLSSTGVPGNVPLVDGKGPVDLASIPVASTFVRDFAGACLELPADIGAFAVP
jgi:hypothetical protein